MHKTNYGRVLAAGLVAVGITLTTAIPAFAEPVDPLAPWGVMRNLMDHGYLCTRLPNSPNLWLCTKDGEPGQICSISDCTVIEAKGHKLSTVTHVPGGMSRSSD